MGSIDGEILTLGLILGTEEGFIDIDGVDEGFIDSPIVVVGIWLGFSLRETDNVGNILGLNNFPLPNNTINETRKKEECGCCLAIC
eukprot:scaffold62431_cov75-Attheya_sp.AAC.3